MTKLDLVEHIYYKVGFPKTEIAKVVGYTFDIIKESLQHEEKVIIAGFGKFVARKKKPRQGRNPQTGNSLEITSRRSLKFKPSPTLSFAVNRAQMKQESLG